MQCKIFRVFDTPVSVEMYVPWSLVCFQAGNLGIAVLVLVRFLCLLLLSQCYRLPHSVFSWSGVTRLTHRINAVQIHVLLFGISIVIESLRTSM